MNGSLDTLALLPDLQTARVAFHSLLFVSKDLGFIFNYVPMGGGLVHMPHGVQKKVFDPLELQAVRSLDVGAGNGTLQQTKVPCRTKHVLKH